MQSHACFTSIELGAKTIGTSKLAPSLICIPAAKMEEKHTFIDLFSVQQPKDNLKPCLRKTQLIKMHCIGHLQNLCS